MAKKSVTEEFLEDRLDGNEAATIREGVWYSGFSRVKSAALEAGAPFVAVWSNGDLCGLCKKFERSLMTDVFKAWMQTSGCVFWFGYSGDEAEEDREGAGKAWSKNRRLTTFPFVRFYWRDGSRRVERTDSGGTWTNGRTLSAGARAMIAKFEELLDEVYG